MTLTLLRALAVSSLLVAPALAQRQPDRFAPAWQPVSAFFHQMLQEEGVVGGALLAFHGDTTTAREFHGFADLGSGRKVDERTIFHWASITKTLTAVALMQLRDRGRLSLDDPAVRYVPELNSIHDPFGAIEGITFRHLLSHSAGFRNGTWPWGGDQPWHPFEPTQWSQLVAMMPYTDVQFKPGSKYSYSNPGLIFVGRTIEQLSGEDYETYLEKNLLRPLGMSSASFDRTPYHLLPHRSNNYDVKDGRSTPNGLDFDTGITVSNGGLNASAPDLVRYLQFLVGATGLAAEARGVLSRASLEEMWRPVLSVGEAQDSIGLGFFIYHREGLRLIGHTGSQRAFRSFFLIDPETKAGAVAVFNTAPVDDPRNPTDASGAKPRIGLLFQGLTQRLVRSVFSLYRQ